MAIDPLRSTQILSSADALLPNQTDTITHAADGGGAAGVASLPGDLTTSVLGTGGATGAPAALANDIVLTLHSQLEAAADANGLVGSVHGLTNLGETVGLGKIGGANLVTTALQAPTALAGGNTSVVGQILPEAHAIEGAASQLVSGAAADAGVSPAVTAPLAHAATALGAVSDAPLTSFANTTVDSLHATLEAAADANGLAGTVHGITNLGETIGLGKLGGGNLATDVLDTPSALLSGDTSTLTHLPTDIGNIAGAAEHLVSGVSTDLASGAFLADPVGHAVGFVSTLATLPVASVANNAIDAVHATLEAGLDPVAPGTIHGVVSLGNSAGLGELGGSNLLTDTLAAPGDLVAGNTTPLTHLPADLGSIGSAVSALPGAVAGDLEGGALGILTHPTTGGGVLGGDLPGAGITSTVTSTATSLVDGATSAAGLGNVGQAVVGALDGTQSGLVHDVAHLPADVLGGAAAGLGPLPGDVGSALGSLGTIAGSAAADASHALGAANLGGALAPVAGAIAGPVAAATSLAGDALHTTSSAVSGLASHLPAGGAGGLVSTVTGLTGGLAGGSGSHDIVTLSVGSQTPTSGLGVDVLSNGGGAAHPVDVHAGSAGAPVPTIANIAILPDTIHVPTATGAGGLDALSGLASTVTGTAAPAAAATSSAAHGLDLGVVHADIPVAHAEPLHALAHAV